MVQFLQKVIKCDGALPLVDELVAPEEFQSGAGVLDTVVDVLLDALLEDVIGQEAEAHHRALEGAPTHTAHTIATNAAGKDRFHICQWEDPSVL